MGNFCHLFADSTGNASTYNLSEEVTEISDFISHNWAVDRFSKFAALAYEYNFDTAFAITCTASCALAVAAAYKVLPLDPQRIEDPYYFEPSTFIGRVFVGPVFLLSCAVAHNLRRHSPLVFLDKTCIHQTDDVFLSIRWV